MLRTRSAHLALTCAILGLASGCEIFLGPALVGSGIAITEFRETEPFDGLDVGGAIQAEVIIGQPQSIEVSGDDNIVPLIITDVRDGTLLIRTDHRGRMQPKERLKVTIVTPELQQLDVSGACDVEVEGLQVGEFNVDVSGASQVVLNGYCDQLIAEISGASELKAVAMETESVEVNASGASDAKVMATDYLIADASGASTIRYTGDPGSVKVDKSGASSISAMKSGRKE